MTHVIAVNPTKMNDTELGELLVRLNDAYRRGEPEVADSEYDQLFNELRRCNPEHPLVLQVEPEPEDVFNGERVKLPIPMLSTDKAYSQAEVEGFVRRVTEAASKARIPLTEVFVQITPKLDGMAGLDHGGRLMSRGKDGYGTDITHAFGRGVIPVGGRGQGAGEIVIDRNFFDEVLAPKYDLSHPRNTVVGLVGAETLEDYHRDVLAAKACHFVPYSTLKSAIIPLTQLSRDWESLMMQVQDVPYLCDGAVAEIIHPELKAAMGATSHHHRWQIALKRNDAEAEANVTGIRMTTGRTGRITPAVEVEPTNLYGVIIRRATAHHAAHLRDSRLGPGARVRLTRSGGVIPYITAVLDPSNQPVDLNHCPSCGGPTEWEGDKYLVCASPASTCRAQASRAIQHFFMTIGTCNGFGPGVCEKLADAGVTDIPTIYGMDVDAFGKVGISPGIAANLVSELARSRREPLEDALLLGALGLRHLGRGDSRKLLAVVPIDRLETLTVEQLQAIPGFGEVTSGPIVTSVQRALPTLNALLALDFNLEQTPLAGDKPESGDGAGPLDGQTVVFTGMMAVGSRSDMERQARQMGAEVASSVSKRVTLLVCGMNVGATKTEKARKLGVRTMSENEYLAMIANHG